MKVTLDKFRQIFWMAIALIFAMLFFAYIMTNLYFYKTDSASGADLITRTNKITGKRTYKVITTNTETKWGTIKDLKKERIK